MNVLKPSILVILVILLSGCSMFSQDDSVEDIPEHILYRDAMRAIEISNWTLAVERLQLLEARYPFGNFSEQTLLELIYVQYRNNSPEAARATADRFIRLYPNHEHVDYAYYLKGLASFEEDRSFLSRFLPLDETQRDPGAAADSFESFSILVRQFPQSRYAADSQRRMQYLKNRLATYEVHVAHYYLKRSAWLAAANRARFVVENYQETQAVPDALAIMAEAYSALSMTDLADNALSILSLNFPDYAVRPFTPQRAGVLNAVTFGLLGSIEYATPTPPVKPNSPINP